MLSFIIHFNVLYHDILVDLKENLKQLRNINHLQIAQKVNGSDEYSTKLALIHQEK